MLRQAARVKFLPHRDWLFTSQNRSIFAVAAVYRISPGHIEVGGSDRVAGAGGSPEIGLAPSKHPGDSVAGDQRKCRNAGSDFPEMLARNALGIEALANVLPKRVYLNRGSPASNKAEPRCRL